MADKAPPFPVDGRRRVALWAPLPVGDAVACFHSSLLVLYTRPRRISSKKRQKNLMPYIGTDPLMSL